MRRSVEAGARLQKHHPVALCRLTGAHVSRFSAIGFPASGFAGTRYDCQVFLDMDSPATGADGTVF